MQKIINFIIQIDVILFGLFLLIYMLKSVVIFLKNAFMHFGASEQELPIEYPNESEALPPKYDVAGFRERMSEIKADENGLYTPIIDEGIDESGVEIITQSLEDEIERKFRI